MINDPADVKLVAKGLQKKAVKDIPKDALEEGKSSDNFVKAIKSFQKDAGLGIDGKIDTHGNTIRALLGYSSDLKKIYPSRYVINNVLAGIKTDGSIGKDIETNKPENKPEDVKYVAFAIKASGIEVPEDSLIEGKSSEEFIESIKAFQKTKAGISEPDGNVTKGGYTFKKLRRYYEIGRIKRTKDGVYGESKDKDLYYNTVDLLTKKLGVEENSDQGKALDKARKAATDNSYFEKITKGINEKMIIKSEDLELEGIRLSSVLEYRMRRLHKFLVAAGLYIGDMKITDGVRSSQKAHQYAVQYYILTGKDMETIKKNLISLFNKYGSAKDKDDNVWAKKAHFKIKLLSNTAIDIDYEKVQKYVNDISFGRSNVTDPAAVGYKPEPECLPLPQGNEPSKHTQGLALDIDSKNFVNKKEAMIDLIALNFGLVRAGGAKETWHFELSDLGISSDEKKLISTLER